MQFLYKIPGYILLLFGGFCLSWGGFIVRSFEQSTVWEILFLRSFFFLLALSIFLISIYKKNTFKIIKESGYPAILGGFVMSFSFVAFVIAMTNTTVANVVFIISTQTMFLAIFGYFYLTLYKYFPPISVLLIVSLLYTWVFGYRNIIVWATLPYFIIHSLIPHKELSKLPRHRGG